MNKIIFVFFAISLVIGVKSDISDVECGCWGAKIETYQATNVSVQVKKKTSLIFAFDSTGSMSDDLSQFRDAAEEILDAFSADVDNPIENYILSVFNDPFVEPVVSTTSASELLTNIDSILIDGGGDCPELALQGLIQAVDVALPNSKAFVFSDASAKDYNRFDELNAKLQEKQISVSFLLTSVCGGKEDEDYLVYEKISKSSGGLVYDLTRSSVGDLLKQLRSTLDSKFETLKTFYYTSAGTKIETINVDSTFSKLNVIVSGSSAELVVKDSNGIAVVATDSYSLENIKYLTFDVSDSVYTIETSAGSGYSVQVGGISDLKFGFGFSLKAPTAESETSIRPLKGFQNVLSIFVSDHNLVKCMTKAVIIPALDEASFPEVIIPFDDKVRNIYTTKPFDIPSVLFKIKVYGYDIKGNVIERVISTGIESTDGALPKVEILNSSLQINQNGRLELICKVTSLIPVKTTWKFESSILNVKNSTQSSQSILTVKNFNVKNVGKYVCEAENKVGKDVADVVVSITIPSVADCKGKKAV